MFIIKLWKYDNKWNEVFLGNDEKGCFSDFSNYIRSLWEEYELEKEIGRAPDDDSYMIGEFFEFFNDDFEYNGPVPYLKEINDGKES